MILLIDNYDSFVYNLARYVGECGFARQIVRNDAILLADIARLNPSHIIISPGPFAPKQAGISLEVIQTLGAYIPILGVCLGHQAIGEAYGANIVRAKMPMHGKASHIIHDGSHLFTTLENPLKVGRYHSLIVSDENFPDVLHISARCENGEIMALHHRHYPVFGVQFHPESILTEKGYDILRRFLSI